MDYETLYEQGWQESVGAFGLDYAETRMFERESVLPGTWQHDAWLDGWLDRAADREKWHLAHCKNHGNAARECGQA